MLAHASRGTRRVPGGCPYERLARGLRLWGRATKERMSYTINKSNGVVAAKASLLRQLCAVRQIDRQIPPARTA